MSAMIISSTESLIGMSKRLESIGVSNIHFYNSRTRDLSTPMVALLPFVDCLILGSDAHGSPHLQRVLMEASAKHVPVLTEESFG
jgi:hypothetical protein